MEKNDTSLRDYLPLGGLGAWEIPDLLKREALHVLQHNILPFWLQNMVDKEYGGFYGRMDGLGQLHRDAEKGAILNARILWAFSAAWRVLRKPEYLSVATRAKQYIIDHFIDKQYGGVYWSLNYKGDPLNTRKQFYAIAFTLYGMAEYARATTNGEALDIAIQLFHTIEKHARDHRYGGYIEARACDWTSISDMRLSSLDANYPKSQNTHLHILEAYTALLRTLKEFPFQEDLQSELSTSITDLIHIFTNHIINHQNHYLQLFFSDDWTPADPNIQSFGHDIEASWLLHEAALVLDDQEIQQNILPFVLSLADAADRGINPDGSMSHETIWTKLQEKTDTDRHWWVQAEAVVGYVNIYQHFRQKEALQKAIHCWQYIKENIIDTQRGEWFWSRDKYGNINSHDDKAGFWKCPYHNTRLCLEIIQRQKTQLKPQ